MSKMCFGVHSYNEDNQINGLDGQNTTDPVVRRGTMGHVSFEKIAESSRLHCYNCKIRHIGPF